MYQSVLRRPRNLDEDIYDLTDPRSKRYDKVFHKKLLTNHKTVEMFLKSDLWNEFTLKYHEKYSS
jgi:hypothetical protein